MRIYHAFSQITPPKERTAVALGFFDGLHAGHAAVIGRAVAAAGEGGLLAAVFTFSMADAAQTKTADGVLATEAEKFSALERCGIELVLSPPFSEFRDMQPQVFVDEVLAGKLNAAVVCCGFDFRFGKRAGAGVKELGELCAARGIALHVIDPVGDGQGKISSTRIRALLAQGDAQAAEQLLGRPFGYALPVVHGKKLGRDLGRPTINQRLPENFVPVRRGVYASLTTVDNVRRPSVTNIGIRPTVDSGAAVNSETHILDFSGDLYGTSPRVELLAFLRDEIKFDTLEALQAQIRADADAALEIALEYLAQTGK